MGSERWGRIHLAPGGDWRRGFSLWELLAVCAILGVIAFLLIPRLFGSSATTARKTACYVLTGNVELQCVLWRRDLGFWPATTLADIGGNPAYFPEGLPVCPVDGSAYTIDGSTHCVVGHGH